jgi:hypothetical protein
MEKETNVSGGLKNMVDSFCPPVVSGELCRHEIDPKEFPKWKPGVGKIFTCKLCGAKVVNYSFWVPPSGERLHLSKKERRKRRKLND